MNFMINHKVYSLCCLEEDFEIVLIAWENFSLADTVEEISDFKRCQPVLKPKSIVKSCQNAEVVFVVSIFCMVSMHHVTGPYV